MRPNENTEIGFRWWNIWAWISIFILVSYTAYIWYSYGNQAATISLAITNIVSIILYIYVLKYNKYAFLLATILSLNIFLWVINGLYLKRRWDHSKVNKNRVNIQRLWKIVIFTIILIPILLFKILTITLMRNSLTEPINQTTISNETQPISGDFDIDKMDEIVKKHKLLKDLNKDCPRMIDEFTRLDKIDIEDNKTIYRHTLIGASFDDEAALMQKEDLKDFICNKSLLKKLMKEGKIFSYHYDDQNQSKTYIFDISINNCTKSPPQTTQAKKTLLSSGIKLYNDKKYKEAAIQLSKAIENNETHAYLWLAYLYKKGIGVKADTKKSVELNKIGCKKKDGDCCYEVAKQTDDLFNSANIYYEKACDLNIKEACFTIGYSYSGIDPLEPKQTKNKRKALKYLSKGCNLKSGDSCYIFAHLTKDPFLSNDYYKKACDLKVGGACNQLAIHYAKGIGKRKDIEIARNLFGLACDNKYQSGCANYANMGKDWEFHESFNYELPKLVP